VTVVLVGFFNPVIFRPDWFSAKELTSKEDAEEAKVDAILPDMSAFSLPWARIQVDRQRFVIESEREPFVRVQDLVAKLFLEQLPSTPVYQLGINRMAHFRLQNRDSMDKIGFALAPLAPWGFWSDRIAAGGEKHGGMRSISMEQSFVDDREFGYIRATVQPSVRVKPGVWIEVNDHYQLTELGVPDSPAALPVGADKIADILVKQFDASIARSEQIMDQVLGLA